MVVGRYPARSR